MSQVRTISAMDNLAVAYGGSFYTILGAGGDPSEWMEGYEELLAEEEIGKPKRWYQTTGAAVNEFADSGAYFIEPRDRFPADLAVLLFPLDGLNVGTLAMFKLKMQDRWFDDVIDNMRRA